MQEVMLMEYYFIGKFSKLIEKNAQTLKECDKNGKLKPHYNCYSS